MIRGVESAIIWTGDVARLAGFYRDTLGMEPRMESPEFAVFGSEQGGLAIGKHSEVSGKSRDPHRIMLNLAVDDCQAEYERLKALGVTFLREPSRESDDLIIATLRDPDANTLQLFQHG